METKNAKQKYYKFGIFCIHQILGSLPELSTTPSCGKAIDFHEKLKSCQKLPNFAQNSPQMKRKGSMAPSIQFEEDTNIPKLYIILAPWAKNRMNLFRAVFKSCSSHFAGLGDFFKTCPSVLLPGLIHAAHLTVWADI